MAKFLLTIYEKNMEKLNRAAVIELANKIRNIEGQTEDENDAYVERFLENVPC